MSFHLGQKIVCVNDAWVHPRVHELPHLPRKGAIYHVRSVEPSRCPGLDCQFLRLAELINPVMTGRDREPSFAGDHFRPVIERKTDISIFTKLLAPKQLERV